MKKKGFALLLVASMAITTTALAATYQSANGRSWAKNTESWDMLSYFGEAYTKVGGSAKISYYRNTKFLGGVTAYVTSGDSDYKTITVRDSLNPIAKKTEFFYSFG